ncbi:MAG TPA: hypothetical protein DCO86_03945 [Spirochaetaceae bacterium]|nr:hypothetical protein [Spirochaetaceae bacterium]
MAVRMAIRTDRTLIYGADTSTPVAANSFNSAYTNFAKYDGEGAQISDAQLNSANKTIESNSGRPLHIFFDLDDDQTVEVYKGTGYVFKISSTVNGNDDVVERGLWLRELNGELGFNIGKVEQNDDDEICVVWGGEHYTQARIDKIKADADNSSNPNDQYEWMEEYQIYNNELKTLTGVYDAANAGEVLEAITSGLIKPSVLDMGSYTYDSASKKYVNGKVKATFDSNGDIRVLETDEVKIYFIFSDKNSSLTAPPVQESHTSGSVEYTKSEVNAEQFKIWNNVFSNAYSTSDLWYSGTKGASNLTFTVNRNTYVSENGNVAEKPFTSKYFRITTQNQSGTDGGRKNGTNYTDFSKICRLDWIDDKLSSGEALLARTNDQGEGNNVGNIFTEYEYAKFSNLNESQSKTKETDSYETWEQIWKLGAVDDMIYGSAGYTGTLLAKMCGKYDGIIDGVRLTNGKDFNSEDLISVSRFNGSSYEDIEPDQDYITDIKNFTYKNGWYEATHEGELHSCKLAGYNNYKDLKKDNWDWEQEKNNCSVGSYAVMTKQQFIDHLNKDHADMLAFYKCTAEEWIDSDKLNFWKYDGGMDCGPAKYAHTKTKFREKYKLAFDEQGRLREVDFGDYTYHSATNDKEEYFESDPNPRSVRQYRFDYGLSVPNYFMKPCNGQDLQ